MAQLEHKVSAVIVTYNCENVIKSCIDSCLDEPIEIVVVDNASSDATLSMLEEYGSQIRLIANPTNTGFTHACNQAIETAAGEHIFLLNPDARLVPGVTSMLLAELERDGRLGAVAPSLIFEDGSPQYYHRRFPTVLPLFVESFVPQQHWLKFSSYRRFIYRDGGLEAGTTVEQPAGAALLLRGRPTLDEQFFIYGSDLDLCRQIYEQGRYIKLVPAASVIHLQSKGGTENPALSGALAVESYAAYRRYFRKHNDVLQLVSFLSLFSCALFLRASLELLRNPRGFADRYARLTCFLRGAGFQTYLEERSQ